MKRKQNIPDWDKDGVWKNVEDKLHQKKKKRFLYWSFIGTISMVLLIGILLSINNVQVLNNSVNKKSISKIDQKTSLEEIQNNFPSDSIIALAENSKQRPEPKIATIELSAINEQQASKNNIKSTSLIIQLKEVAISTINSKRKNKTKSKTHIINSVHQNISFEKKEIKSAVHTANDVLVLLPTLPINSLSINLISSDTILTNDFKLPLSPNNNQKRTSTFWWIENGLSFGKKSAINLTEQFIDRNTTEQFRFMHTNALGIQRFLNKSWSLKVGLAYQTIYEKYEYDRVLTIEEQIFLDEAIVYNLRKGITYFEPGWTTQRTTRARSIINNNFIHRLSLPVEFIYSLKKDSWSFEPSLGFRFQFFQQFNGVITEDGDHLFDLRKINDTYYSKNLSMGLITSLNLKYNISQKASLGLKLTYERDDFLNLIKNDFSFRYETIGVQLGYYHSF